MDGIKSADLGSAPTERPYVAGVQWSAIIAISLLFVVLFAPILLSMGRDWLNDEDMGHGFFVIPVALYVVWCRKDEILNLKLAPSFWGYLVLVFGFLLLLAGILGAEFYVSRVGMLVSLAGIIYAVGGPPLLRIVVFPLFLLVFMIRIPAVIYGQITLPLQLFASSVAEQLLMLMGIPVLRDGNILELASQRLSVVEACSGIRSLLTLMFLSLAYGFMFEKRTSIRTVLFLTAIPTSIVANSLRITLTGVLSEYDTKLAEGIYHTMEGWVVFIISLAVLLLIHFLAGRFFPAKVNPAKEGKDSEAAV